MIMIFSLLAAFSLPGGAFAADGAHPDPSRHPVYSRYDFGNSSAVINVAVQPLAVPVGVIGEVMKRDRVLRAALKERGMEIRFHPFLKGDDIVPFLRGGKIDAAMAGDMSTIATSASCDITVVALAKLGFSSVLSSGHLTAAGLKGKRIGYPPFSNAHYGLLAALASAGLKESDVTMVPMEIHEMVDAFAGGKIDAIAAFEPVPTLALKKIKNSLRVYRYLNSSYLYFGRSFAARNPEGASLIAAAMVRALGWLSKNEDHRRLAGEWTLAAEHALQGKPVSLSAEDIALLTMNDIRSIASAPVIPGRDLTADGSLRKKFVFLQSHGKVPPGASWERVLPSFDRGVVSDVLTHPKKYRINIFDYDTGTADR